MDSQLVLDAAELRRRGVLRPGERTRGVMTWVDEAGRTTASIAYWADLVDAREVRLVFSIADASGASRQVEQGLGVAITRVGFGDRLWFAIDGRRAARLVLVASGERFEAGIGAVGTMFMMRDLSGCFLTANLHCQPDCLTKRTCAMRRVVVAVSLSIAILHAGAAPSSAREIVPFSGYSTGTVVVKTQERRLYYVLDGGRAVRYPVGVGKAGKTWTGTAYIDGKHLRPAWSPPEEIRQDKPLIPVVIASGSPSNPMGAAALTLDQGQYAIHGTNQPDSIGHFVSYGCIRMFNSDVMDLYQRVSVGTPVVVLP